MGNNCETIQYYRLRVLGLGELREIARAKAKGEGIPVGWIKAADRDAVLHFLEPTQ